MRTAPQTDGVPGQISRAEHPRAVPQSLHTFYHIQDSFLTIQPSRASTSPS